MAGNFCGVLIFVIFVVDLAVINISHPRKLMPTSPSLGRLHEAVPTNIVAARPSISKQQ